MALHSNLGMQDRSEASGSDRKLKSNCAKSREFLIRFLRPPADTVSSGDFPFTATLHQGERCEG